MTDSKRLAPPYGCLIDRSQTINFEFEGQSFLGHPGDSIASALIANQQWLLSRSFKYHRPRGPLTMAGQDANTLIQIGSEPNVLADKAELTTDLSAKGQNYSGSLAKDRDAYLDRCGRFLPVGFYYRSFFKPKGIWNKWEGFIRKKAGLGRLDLDAKPEYYDKVYLFHDLAVIGAGPAGMRAALSAAQQGAKVLLVDENPILGGALTYHYSGIEQDQSHAEQMLKQLRAQIEACDNIQVLLKATCSGWFTDNYLSIIQGQRMYKARAKQCIVASGCFEQHVVFRNNDLPGVILCSAAERLLHHYAIKPGQVATVLAGNDEAIHCAISLHKAGVVVKAVVDMRKAPINSALLTQLQSLDIAYKNKATVYQANAKEKNNGSASQLASVEVRPITGQGQVGDDYEIIHCDLLCMSAGFMPAYQLLCQAGAQLRYNDELASFSLVNLPKDLQVCGAANGRGGLSSALADSEYAAQVALNKLGLTEATKIEDAVSNNELELSQLEDQQSNFSWPIFKHPKGREFVDFDEDLQIKDIISTTALGYRDIQLVKRFSTVGMGPSQGRHSALPTARIVAKATDRSVSATGVTTARPPYAAEKVAHCGGRGFDPIRKTPMHSRHLSLGAQTMPAGNWQRPAFYGDKNSRDLCVQAEAQHVRNKVGLIDVSTLGGLDIRGPDAAEFINRIYTFGFLKQAVGKTRYAVLTNEQGVVVDDGVACRISEDYFYVSATTSGVDNVYRGMQKWNAQWRLDVDIANVSSAFAAVNLAGPDARAVLQKLVPEVDLSSEGFPYLAYREFEIHGIAARVLRVGFVGELGYEIHVPSRYGLALWDLLMEAGKDFDIKPFGVEAQRLLRLEKGHIIIGQDTDGMTHPGEVDLQWALSKNKPFYVGCRSVDILLAQKQKRKLVGFELELGAQDERPKEGHLVLASEGQAADIWGNITSCEYSPNLNKVIGLAYTSANAAEPGSTIHIRCDSGQVQCAKVVALPFYDPDQSRQAI